MRSTTNRLLLASASFMAIAAAVPALPNIAEAQIEEITVSVRAREETLYDVPGSVTAFTASQLESAGVSRAEDFITLTPGVTIVDTAEAGDTQVNIRGINGARDAENSFAFIVDGILISNPSAFNREFLDLEQIEILKGPQGALYGRNAAAGAIVVTTKKPGNEEEATVKTSFAEESTVVTSSTIGGPIVENELFFRLSAAFRETDGFFKNQFFQEDNVDDYMGYDVSGRLVWEASPDLEIDTKFRYAEVDAAAISFNASFALPNAGLSNDVDDHTFVYSNNVDPSNEQQAFDLSTRINYEQDWGTITAWGLFSDITQDFLADGTSAAFGIFAAEPNCIASTAAVNAAGIPVSPPTAIGPTPATSLYPPYSPTTCDGYQYQERNQTDFSFEMRVSSHDDQRLRWQGGVYYLNIEREVGVAQGLDTGLPIPPQLFNPGAIATTVALVHDEFNSDIYAVFGNVSYDLMDNLELSGALRFDREEREVTNLINGAFRQTFIDVNADGIFNDPLNPGFNDGAGGFNPTIPDDEETFQQLQPKVSFNWDITETFGQSIDNFNVFGSWGVGFKSGGFNNSGSQATINTFINTAPGGGARNAVPVVIQDVYDKETSSAFELGFKGRAMDGRLTFEAAGYYVEVEDMQFFEFFAGPFGLLRLVSNIDEVELYGVEAGASFQAFEWLQLFGGINVTESEIKENSSRADTVGNQSPYTPDYTGNVGAQVNFPIRETWEFFGRVDYSFVGETWFHTIQDETRVTQFDAAFGAVAATGDYSVTQRDSYATMDLRVGVEGENLSLILYGTNLFNEDYLEEVIPAPEFGGSFVHDGNKSQWGIEVKYTW